MKFLNISTKELASSNSRRVISFFLLLLIIEYSITIVEGHCDSLRLPKIKTNGKWFVDQNNRIILLRGINAVQKSFPWIPNQEARVNLSNMAILSWYKKFGYNVVRLGYMWSGLFPQKGQLNQTYVNEMSKIVDALESYGMYVIIDLHQDMMSTKFGSYDGVPRWIIDEMPNSKRPFPWPFSNLKKNSFTAYVTESCGFAFQCLYDNVTNAETYFHDYWSNIAKIYNNKSSILAYELMNEPWAGDVYANPLRLLPGIAGKYNLLRLYDNVHPVIRKYDQDTLIMYEPVTWATMSRSGLLGTGFDHPPGYDKKGTVFSWHYYCWLLDLESPEKLNPLLRNVFCKNWQINTYFNTVEAEMEKLGGASFLTEFGVCWSHTKDGKLNPSECNYILDKCDKNFQSWTYWDSSTLFDESLNPNLQFLKSFSRVYPMATNGIPLSLNYNSTTNEFKYSYAHHSTSFSQAQLTTDIFIPQLLYPNGFNISISNDFIWNHDQTNSKLYVRLNNLLLDKFNTNQTFEYVNDVNISIRPK